MGHSKTLSSSSAVVINTFWRRRDVLIIVLACLLVWQSFFLLSDKPMGQNLKNLNVRQRLARSEALWEETIEKRNGLMQTYADQLDPFPTGEPLPLYTLWSFFPPTFGCPHELVRVGTIMDGGRWICGLSVISPSISYRKMLPSSIRSLPTTLKREEEEECVVYSFGNIHDTFEAEILEKTRCKVYGFESNRFKFGSSITENPKYLGRFSFFPFELTAGLDDHLAMPPQWSLKALIEGFGHKHVSILRLDLEGMEFDVLSDFISSFLQSEEPVPIGQITVELHATSVSVVQMAAWWQRMEAAGFRAFSHETNLVYANMVREKGPPALATIGFLNVLGSHPVIS